MAYPAQRLHFFPTAWQNPRLCPEITYFLKQPRFSPDQLLVVLAIGLAVAALSVWRYVMLQ